VDLRDIRIVKKVGGTIDDTELVEGLALNQHVLVNAGGPTRMEKAKIGLIQSQLSSPKPDVSFIPVNYQAVSDDRFSTDGQPDCRQ
jgi:T-complex protein 1 subunit delta